MILYFTLPLNIEQIHNLSYQHALTLMVMAEHQRKLVIRSSEKNRKI